MGLVRCYAPLVPGGILSAPVEPVAVHEISHGTTSTTIQLELTRADGSPFTASLLKNADTSFVLVLQIIAFE